MDTSIKDIMAQVTAEQEKQRTSEFVQDMVRMMGARNGQGQGQEQGYGRRGYNVQNGQPRVCFTCRQPGHYSNQCPEKMAFQQPPPQPRQPAAAQPAPATDMSNKLEEFKTEITESMAKMRAEILTINRNHVLYEMNGSIDPQQFGKLLTSVASIKKNIDTIAVAHKAQQTRVAAIAESIKRIGARVDDLDYKWDKLEDRYELPTAEELGLSDDEDITIEDTEDDEEDEGGEEAEGVVPKHNPKPQSPAKKTPPPKPKRAAAAAPAGAPVAKKRAPRGAAK